MTPSRQILRASIVSALLGCGRVEESPEAVTAMDATSDAATDTLVCADARTSPRPDAVIDDAPLPDLGYRAAARMHHAREGHGSCVLPDGRLLVVGGFDNTSSKVMELEAYDVASDTWTVVAGWPELDSMPTTCLVVGKRTIVLGAGSSGARARVFEPETGRLATVIALPYELAPGSTLIRLRDGRFLGFTAISKRAFFYDFERNVATPAPAPPHASIAPIMHMLTDGRVAVVQGYASSGILDRSTQVFDPIANEWTLEPDHPFDGILRSLALADGRLLIGSYPKEIHGPQNAFEPTPFAMLDPSCGTWSTTWLPRAGSYGTATQLPSGKVLVLADSHVPTASNVDSNVSALYDPATDHWSIYAPLPVRFGFYSPPVIDALPGGQVVFTGGAPLCGHGCSLRGTPLVFVLDHPP